MVEHVPNVFCVSCMLLSQNVFCVSCMLLSQYLYMVAPSNRLIEQFRIEGDRISCRILLTVVCGLGTHYCPAN
jgi:hypothetical protein